jgi:hypothetical protein
LFVVGVGGGPALAATVARGLAASRNLAVVTFADDGVSHDEMARVLASEALPVVVASERQVLEPARI